MGCMSSKKKNEQKLKEKNYLEQNKAGQNMLNNLYAKNESLGNQQIYYHNNEDNMNGLNNNDDDSDDENEDPVQESKINNDNKKEKKPIPINSKKTVAVSCGMSLNKNSIHLKKSENNKNYYLTFDYNCNEETVISIFYFGNDNFDVKTKITQKIEINSKKFSKIDAFKFSSGKNLEFPKETCYIDISLFNANDFNVFKENLYPLIIKMENYTNDLTEKKIFYSYCILKKINNQFNGKIIKQKIEIGGKAYFMNEIYGLVGSNDKDQGQEEEKLCSICLTDKINTIILPCKHMCVCFDCCEDLREKAKKCPICRNRF